MGGRIGREILGAGQILFLVFAMGSHILKFSIMMNTVTSHGTCTIVFSVVGMVVCLICTLPRTLKKVSYLAVASFVSILSAVAVTMVGVGVERPHGGKVDMIVQTDLYKGFEAVTNIIFAYAGESLSFSFSFSFSFRFPLLSLLLLLHRTDDNEIKATLPSSPSSPSSGTRPPFPKPSISSKAPTSSSTCSSPS